MSSFIYIVLTLLTFATLTMGNITFTVVLSIVLLFCITFLKGQLISDYFMGLGEVQLRYRIIPILWLIFVITGILIAYFLPV